MRREKAFKPLTLKLSAIADEAVRQQIETLFNQFNAERARSNDAARKAALADAESGIAMQQARMAFIQLLLTAGEHLEPIRGEQTWTTYRKDGEIVFECPFTEVDMRNAMRVQRANVDQAARQIGVGEDLYAGEGDEEAQATIGFSGAPHRDD
jgi:hypothetical protein